MRPVIGFGLAVLISVVFASSSAHADTVSLVGDLDCFGLGGACPDGSLFRDELGGFFFANNQGPGDPAFTDSWQAPAVVSYNHTYVFGPALSATLVTRIAGIHDINLSDSYTVLFNGTPVGSIAANASDDGFQEVLTYLFSVPVNLLTGNDVVSYSGMLGTDGFIVDYSRLTLSDDTLPGTVPVPEPTSLVLFVSGLAVAAGIRRRAKEMQFLQTRRNSCPDSSPMASPSRPCSPSSDQQLRRKRSTSSPI